MTHSGNVPGMPPTTRTWTATDTPQAHAEIGAEVESVLKAHDALKEARRRRNEVIRRHREAGVDPRDLVKICRKAGWSRCASNTIHTIISGANPDE